MLQDAVPFLICPACSRPLSLSGLALTCAQGHSFDVSRYGYASLLLGANPQTGDSPSMVAEREAFLGAGHFGFLVDALADRAGAAISGVPGCIADIGGGTGRYSAAVLERALDRVGIVVDSSKYALRRAARAHPRLAAVAADVWRGIPLADGAAALVLNVFAPRHVREMRRVLSPCGRAVVCTPTPRHLAEVIEPLGLLSVQLDKWERLRVKMGDAFALQDVAVVEQALTLDAEGLRALALMGPSAHHIDPVALSASIATLSLPVSVTASVRISVHAPNTTGDRLS